MQIQRTPHGFDCKAVTSPAGRWPSGGVGALHLDWQYGTSGAGCLALEPDEKES